LLALISLMLLTGCSAGAGTSPTVATATAEKSSLPATPPLIVPSPVNQLPTEPALVQAGPTLFEVSWEEREIFRSGLVEAERGILGQLDNATTYHIRLELDDSLTSLTGKQETRYTNRTDSKLDHLVFHLFPNLLGGSLSLSMAQVDGQVVAPQNVASGAIMRVPLAEPLLPGASLTTYMEFETRIPTDTASNFGIFVFADNILALAHFYPLVSVFDDEGWNTELPVPGGDIVYSESSFYLVEVTAPGHVLMAASGIELARERLGDRQLVTYAAGPMRDFFLAASERYRLQSATYGNTVINSYLPEGYSPAAGFTLDVVSAALASFGARLGPYPYTELDVVSTPLLALGVEYPGIFANALRLHDHDDPENGNLNRILLESTTAHETGHQWFYGLVGNDQLDEPWLDESLTQYMTWLYYVDRYGASNALGFRQALLDRWDRVEMAEIPIGLPVRAYENGQYGAIVYGRGAIFFDELADQMGQDKFDEFLTGYFAANKWDVATTDLLRQSAEGACQCDLTGLFEDWVYEK
jgi:hypothetical protein